MVTSPPRHPEITVSFLQTHPRREHHTRPPAVFREQSRPANRRRCWDFSRAETDCWSQSRWAWRRPASRRTLRFLASGPCARHVAGDSRRWRGRFGQSNTWPPWEREPQTEASDEFLYNNDSSSSLWSVSFFSHDDSRFLQKSSKNPLIFIPSQHHATFS